MACYCQWSKSAKVSTIFECDQAEWNDDKQNSLLVNMPTEKEGCVATQRNRADEGVPSRFEEKFDQKRLLPLADFDGKQGTF